MPKVKKKKMIKKERNGERVNVKEKGKRRPIDGNNRACAGNTLRETE